MTPNRIQELQNDWQHVEKVRDDETFRAFRRKLYLATKEHIEIGLTAGTYELTKLWLDRTRLIIETNLRVTILTLHIEQIMALLDLPGVVEQLATEGTNIKELAALCLQCSAVTSLKNYGIAECIVEDTLARWLNKTTKPGCRYTPEEIVGILYGPLVWSIYSNDVEEYDELPAHLYRSNVSILAEKKADNCEQYVSATALPDTLC